MSVEARLGVVGARVQADEHADYWRDALRGAPEELSLPYDRRRSPEPAERSADVTTTISSDASIALYEVAAVQGTPLVVIVLAAVAVLFSRLGAGRDMVLGAGRGMDGGDDSTVVPVRVDLSGNLSIADALSRVRRTVQAGSAYAAAKFEDIVTAVGATRSTARHPLFQTVVTHRALEAEQDGSSRSALRGHDSAARLDLVFECIERADSLDIRIEYATDLFDRETIDALGRRLSRVFEAFASDVNAPVSQIDVRLGSDHPIAAALTGTTTHDLPALLAAADVQFGDRTALACATNTLTFTELGEESARFARALVARGIGPESIVAVALPRTPAAVIALRAILATGAAYLLVDLKYPQARNEYVLSDAEPELIVDEPTFAQLSTESATMAATPLTDADRVRPLRSQCPAYVIYTSGSTGTPKGVVGTYAALANRLVWQRDLLADSGTQIAKSSLSFIDGSTELLAAFLTGVTSVLADDEGSRDIGTLAELIERHDASRMTAVPSLAGAINEIKPQAARRIDTWFLSGEPLDAAVIDVLTSNPSSDRRPRVLNSYGSSEVAGDVCVWDAAEWTRDGAFARQHRRVLIGSEVPGTAGFVLDEQLQPVPDGVVGELYVAGVQCARGYWRRPALTAQRFVADPFGSGQRLFRTGDLVRRVRGGELEFISRADNQISIRGFRVEPGDVEVAITSFPGVDAALVTTAAGAGTEQLVAYVAGLKDIDKQGLREHLRTWLPDYMIPDRFVVMAQLPTLPNGKVDRAALTQADHTPTGQPETVPEVRIADDGQRVVQPRTPVEAEVALQWAIALGIEGIGRSQDPMALGATSLSLLKVLTALADRYGVRVPVGIALADPTPAGIAAQITSPKRDRSLPPTVVVLDRGARPLWAICGAGGNTASFVPLARELAGEFTTYALQQQGLENRALPDFTVAKMVRRYVSIIRKIQPHGPYQLTGHSLGGIVALEVARELAAAGELVDPPILLDAFLPAPVAAEFAAASRHTVDSPEPQQAERVVTHAPTAPPLRQRLLTHWRVYTAGLLRREPTLQEELFWEVGSRVGNRHRIAPWSGDAVVYMSADNPNDPAWWATLITGNLEIVRVPGNHLSVVRRPVVGDIAEKIRAVETIRSADTESAALAVS
ncbi:MAG: amino acid adenylation domain-containing protein [Rhodococcus sp.]|nr:amino acid adenylation domain-containing protein [Rhodococcus sp. (in: high G+C Gram-positive bacteria)]